VVHGLRCHGEPAHGSVAELSGVVGAPALHRAVADERARVFHTGPKTRGIDRTVDDCGLEHIEVPAVADLALVVHARAANGLICVEDAGMTPTGADCRWHRSAASGEL